MGAIALLPRRQNAIRFFHWRMRERQFTTNISTRGILWRLESTENPFSTGAPPGAYWESLRRSPKHPSRFGRGNTFQFPTPLTPSDPLHPIRPLEPSSPPSLPAVPPASSLIKYYIIFYSAPSLPSLPEKLWITRPMIIIIIQRIIEVLWLCAILVDVDINNDVDIDIPILTHFANK